MIDPTTRGLPALHRGFWSATAYADAWETPRLGEGTLLTLWQSHELSTDGQSYPKDSTDAKRGLC